MLISLLALAQAREPFSAIRYLVEEGVHPPIDQAYGLALSLVDEGSCQTPGQVGVSPSPLHFPSITNSHRLCVGPELRRADFYPPFRWPVAGASAGDQ